MSNESSARVRARMFECPYRRSTSCGQLDVALGWVQPVTLEQCDACFLKGPSSQASKTMRDGIGAQVVANVLADLPRNPPSVILTVLGRHVPDRAERQRLLLTVAPRIGEEAARSFAAAVGGEALLRQVAAAFAGMSPHQRAMARTPGERWGAVDSLWTRVQKEIDAGERPPAEWSAAQKITFFAAAKWSGRRVSLEVLNTRTVSCTGLDLDGNRVKDPCPSRRESKAGYSYCADCGCGERPAAKLDDKLLHVELACPRAMPGFCNADVTT